MTVLELIEKLQGLSEEFEDFNVIVSVGDEDNFDVVDTLVNKRSEVVELLLED